MSSLYANEVEKYQEQIQDIEKRLNEISQIKIQIKAKCQTEFGDRVLVCTDAYGFDPSLAKPLTWTEGNYWVGLLSLEDIDKEYKLIIETEHGEIIWEPFDGNRRIEDHQKSSNLIVLSIEFGKQ